MEQLLTTKLYIPPTRPELVPRPRLIDQLNQGLHRNLTLISAPAGFGKTTLVGEWITSRARPVTWVSLDEGDNDPVRFLTYFINALTRVQGAEEQIGDAALGMLQSPQSPPAETILTSLINEIATVPESIIFVLDDYHVIEASQVDHILAFLLDNLPPQLHLVIATREDPHLPLSRLRARDQMTELRAADLRFTSSEAAEFLNQVMGLNLSHEDITALENRTEGWIAGLQLAAISMRGRADDVNFIESFTGSHRLVLDYLVDEVLNQQDESVQTFLLQTAILEQLNGSLCDALTGFDNSQQILEMLERSNLFIIPLDNERRWYRYHHLFADVLQARLMVEQLGQVPALHQQASEWFEQKELWPEAIHHALAPNDLERVAGIAELSWQAMDDSFQSATWLSWMKVLPEDMIRTRPVLCTHYAWALWMDGELEASETRLQDAEQWLDPDGNIGAQPEDIVDGMVVMDEDQLRTLPARIALARTYIAQAQGDVSGAVKYAELALKLIPEEDHLERTQATTSLGFTFWASGDLDQAHKALAGWFDSMLNEGNVVFAIASTFALADIMIAQGRLRDAVKAYQQSLQLASEQDEHVRRVIAHLYLGLAMVYHEMDDQDAFDLHLQKSKELGRESTLVDWPYRWHLAQARIKESQGDLEAALDQLDEAKRLYVRVSVPDVRPINALKAEVYLRQGRLPEAMAWVQERDLSFDDELNYLVEFEQITLARVLIADYQSKNVELSILQAIELLERLQIVAQNKKRMGSVIEILMLLALAHQARGDMPRALAPLERALAMAEPEGYFRIFVDEGPPMAALLREAAKHGIAPNYINQLRVAFGEAENRISVNQVLIDPLSKRELEVLQLLRTELNGPEIARELMVSLTTIRTHTQNIYNKLGVNNRRAAVRRAEELDLF